MVASWRREREREGEANQHIIMLRKRRPLRALYKVRLICILIWGSLTGHCCVDEVLHPHVLPIYQILGNNFLFQQDNASIPAIWQGTVCKLVVPYPLDWRSRSRSISDRHPWDILGQRVHDRNPFQLLHFPHLNTSWLNNCNVFREGVGYNPRLLLSMHKRLV